MKIYLKSTLENITENTKIQNKTTAKKEHNKITYQIDKDKYIIKIISPNKLIIHRENDDIENTMYFETNKIISSNYVIKKEGYTLEIEIKTDDLNIKENIIIIHYTVIESNTKYKYKIEMSE